MMTDKVLEVPVKDREAVIRYYLEVRRRRAAKAAEAAKEKESK